MNLNRSLSKIGTLTRSDLLALDKAFDVTKISNQVYGFESDLMKPADFRDAKNYGVRNIKEIVQSDKYACFATVDSSQREVVKRIAFGYGIKREMVVDDFMCFRGFYAMKHDDQHMAPTHQLMFVLGNAGHRLWSAGRKNLLVPKRGDVLVLDIYKKHALFPNVDLTLRQCEQKPFKFILAGYSNDD